MLEKPPIERCRKRYSAALSSSPRRCWPRWTVTATKVYSTAAECDAAVAAGTAKFFEAFTEHPPLQREGEVAVKRGTSSDEGPQYGRGACDVGVGRSGGREGVIALLIGKFVPFSPDIPVNSYSDAAGKLVRVTMQKCNNNFGDNFARPINVLTSHSYCFANMVIAPRFKPKSAQVLKVA